MRFFSICYYLAILLIFTLGCSNNDPTSSSIFKMDPDLNSSQSLIKVGVSDYDENGSPVSGQGAMGIFQAHIDPDQLTGEMISTRSNSSTDVVEVVDITNFLQIAPCNDCARITGISIDSNENLVVNIGIKHPFLAGDPLKPISGINRADLHVFNVEGIVVSDGSGAMDFPTMGKSTGSVNLLSADGFTGYLDNSLDSIYSTTADIHPYVLHFDDYSLGNFDPLNPMGFADVTDPPPSGNLVMAMGSDYDVQDYVFDNSTEPFDFIFVVGCTYGVASDSKSERFSPEYRVPQHLKKAASEVSVEITRNNLMAGYISSDADIEVSVVDISHGVAMGTSLNEMFSVSDVESVSIEIPGIISTTVVSSTPTGGTGHDPADPLIYQFTIQNEQNALSGAYYGLVKVLDAYLPGQNQSPLLVGMDGIERVEPIENPLTTLFAIDEFATYQRFTINVEMENTPPTVGPVEGCEEVIAGIGFIFSVDAFDPDSGQSLTYNWDNGDNTPGVYDDGTVVDDDSIELTFDNPGNFTVDVQVDDGFGGVTTSSEPLNVTVLPSGIFVDADYTGGSNDGTIDHPYTDIQTGINNAPAGGYVYVLPAANHYSVFSISGTARNVIGMDMDCGLLRPTVDVTSANSFLNSASDSSIERIIFDLNIVSGGSDIVGLSGSSNVTVKNCRFTGDSELPNTTVLRLTSLTDSSIANNEWVNFRVNAPITNYRYSYMLIGTGCTNVTVLHNELHDIGIPDLGTDTSWSGIWGIRFGYPYCTNVVVTNNLFYDFFDHSFVPNGYTSTSNVLHAASAGNQNDFQFIHNTIDNFDCNNGDTLKNAWTVGIYCAMTPGLIIDHNVFKSENHYEGTEWIYHNSAGFWADSISLTYANYSCVYWGDPPPLGGSQQTFSYLNMIGKGTGSYDQNNLVDPDFDYTTGSNFYHPQNTTVATGGSDGGEMGCFGGTDGDWTPPSQIYP